LYIILVYFGDAPAKICLKSSNVWLMLYFKRH